MMAMAAAALLWWPVEAAGREAEFVLETQAPEVVLIVGAELDGEKGCYATVETATGRSWVQNRSPRDWRERAGDVCEVAAQRESGGVAVRIVLLDRKLVGLAWVYAQERPGGGWRRVARWDVDDGPPRLVAEGRWTLESVSVAAGAEEVAWTAPQGADGGRPVALLWRGRVEWLPWDGRGLVMAVDAGETDRTVTLLYWRR